MQKEWHATYKGRMGNSAYSWKTDHNWLQMCVCYEARFYKVNSKFKARLIALSCSQLGLDYCETYFRVVNFTLVWLFFILFVTLKGWCYQHLDVESAYLYSLLTEQVYMYQPKGSAKEQSCFTFKTGRVWPTSKWSSMIQRTW